MVDIDFLPIEYRRKCQQRQSQPWQIFAAAIVLGLMVAAAILQQQHWRLLQSDLAAIAPSYKTAADVQCRLADVENRLWRARANVELYTYLQHPWPRTRLLSSLVSPMTDGIVLQHVKISREPPTAPAHPKAAEGRAEHAALKATPPARRDLAKLRGRLDAMPTVVVLKGVADDVAAMYRYLGKLEVADIFDNVELDYYNSLDGKAGKGMEFRVLVTVQPGYGQPGGPAKPRSVVARK